MTANTNEDEIWVTRDGRRLRVAEMSEEHVRNALRMLIRVNTRRLMALRVLALALRPTLKAADAADEEAGALLQQSIHDEFMDDEHRYGNSDT